MVQRLAYWDNIKMLLIFLVVLGHAIAYAQWAGDTGLLCVYNCIFSFHMPVFVFISGYFSKRITGPRKKDIEILLYPYLVFQVLNVFYVRYIEHNPASWNMFIPLHQNWYILALFMWRLIIPYFQYVNKWMGIAIALGLSLIFSKYQVPNNLFALNYVFVFLPFFVLGYYIDETDIQKIQKRPFNILAIMAVLVLFAAIIVGTYHSINFGLTITQAFKPPYICTSYISYGLRFVGFVLSFMLIYLMFVMKGKLETSNANRLDFSGGGHYSRLFGALFLRDTIMERTAEFKLDDKSRNMYSNIFNTMLGILPSKSNKNICTTIRLRCFKRDV